MRARIAAILITGLAALLPAILPAAEDKPAAVPKAQPVKFVPEQQSSKGSVTLGGRRIDFEAVSGTLVVHAKDWDDVPQNADPEAKEPPAEASMFYVAYFASGDRKVPRPITFFFNGGPGSSTVWLHMGAFGPRRIVTATDAHTPAAPYGVVNNEYSLLDVSDLVFIDAPGTGFSRIAGKEREKAFYGVDADAHAFADFITQFLSKYARWNSPKYIFGESYGTTRSAVLANLLQTEYSVDLNGVILLSQILMFDGSADGPEFNPGIDMPYQLALPTYAATAWYHHKLPGAARELPALLAEVEQFAMHDYAEALLQGGELPAERRHAIAQQLHQYTGLPTDYIEKADLRISGGVFEKALQDDAGLTTGRLDSRFSGTTLRSAGQGGGLRSAVRGDQLSLRLGLQRLRSQRAEGECGAPVQVRDSHLANLEFPAPAAGGADTAAAGDQCDAGPGGGNEVQPRSQGDGQRRLLRHRDAVLRGQVRNSPPADPGESAQEHRVPLLRVRTHGLRARALGPRAARQRRRLHPSQRQSRHALRHAQCCSSTRTAPTRPSTARIAVGRNDRP